MLYKALGYSVWQGVKWYAGHKLPSRRLVVGGAVALGAATAFAVANVLNSDD
jgi:hypothetical protein